MPVRTLPARDVTLTNGRGVVTTNALDLELNIEKSWSFEKSRRYARALGLRTKRDWETWASSNERPATMPRYPHRAYADQGWQGWLDFLHGLTETPSRYRAFADARLFARTLRLRTKRDWGMWVRASDTPTDLPHAPQQVYANEGWISWPDFLHEGATPPSRHAPFVEARAYAHGLGLRSRRAWNEWCVSRKRPTDIPADPSHVYMGEGWRGWADWLDAGTAQVATPPRRLFVPFVEARAYAHGLGLRSRRAWTTWAASGSCPPTIPRDPAQVYRADGWTHWPDFLGYEFKPRA